MQGDADLQAGRSESRHADHVPLDGATLGFRSKTELVLEHLREQLLAGRPGPGERLVVDRVASQLGVSKVPVREAVTRLIGEGWLQHRPNIGPVVPTFTSHEVLETALIRAAVEDVAIAEAVALHDDQTLGILDGLIISMADEVDRFPQLNVQLHAAVIAPAPFEQMRRLADSLQKQALRFATVHVMPSYRTNAHQEHTLIVAAVRSGDAEKAQKLNRAHVLEAAHRLAAHIDRGAC